MIKKSKIDSLSLEDLRELSVKLGEKEFRGNQLFKWIYNKGVTDFNLMTDLPKKIREDLIDRYDFTNLKIKRVLTSNIDFSKKFLFETEDGSYFESVFMMDDERVTICVSTQIGCRMGCSFCNTAKVGFKRNLTVGEMIRQIMEVKKNVENDRIKVTNIVFMGMGEPLDNFENLIRTIDIILSEDGLNFSHRKVTVSTCGVVDKLVELAKISKVNIAVSLNAVSDEKRDIIMPINKKYNISKLIEAIRTLPIPKRKRITIEYVLIKGFNDSSRDAKQLAGLLKGIPVKVNLIPYNETKGDFYESSDLNNALNFQRTLIKQGIATFIRKSFGRDIEAACGQLYASYIGDKGGNS